LEALYNYLRGEDFTEIYSSPILDRNGDESIKYLSTSKYIRNKQNNDDVYRSLEIESKNDDRESQCDLNRSYHGDRTISPADMRKLYRNISMLRYNDIAKELAKEDDFKPQSGVTADVSLMTVANDTGHQNANFGDQQDPYMYAVDENIDPTRKLMDSTDASLANFLSRPVKIGEFDWATSTSLFAQINPWQAYLQNARVINRVNNFNLLRSKLNLKLVINGNGFFYGRAIASYLPFASKDPLSQNRALIPEDVVQATQQPHVFLDPTLSTGGNMKLPFFHYKNYLDVPTSEWAELGQLTIRSIQALKHANGATESVTVTVFAWLEDVSMAVLTGVNANTIVPQSGKEVDMANANGFISGPATAVQKAATVLGSVPMIAPFATATAEGAGMVANIAKALGYCRPPVTKDPDPYKPVPISSLALTTVPDQLHKLTIDDKQELSIDPRISGLGAADPLNIKEIAKRESYLTSFTWSIGSAPETLLWNSRISPTLWAEDSLTPVGFHFPASAMASLPFKYWTGKMRFRFQIVASAFHKGRIKIVYDPNFLASGDEYNVNYLEVIDIADKKDFTIEIGNGQPTTLLTHSNPGLDSVTTLYGNSAFTSKGPGNGVIGMYVVNELTSPNSTVNNDVDINVYISMGDDFEVFVPEGNFQNFVFKPQSGVEHTPDCEMTAEPSAPQQSEATSVGPGTTNHALINKVYTGESISSFRCLLKRYNLHQNLIFSSGFSNAVHFGRRNMYPYLRGNVTGAVNVTGAANPYNYCNTILLHWVTYAFSGWRGSIRWKLLLRGYREENRGPVSYIQRVPVGELGYQKNVTLGAVFTTDAQAAQNVMTREGTYPQSSRPLSGVEGSLYQTGLINPNVEFEVPYYSLYRFSPGKAEDLTTTLDYNEGFDYRIFGALGDDTAFDAHCAIGEDFQTYFFTGLPPMYYEAVPPVP